MSTEFYNRNWRMPKSSNSNKASNYSMSFDGSGQVITFPSSIDLGLNSTISFWANFTNGGVFLGEDSYGSDYIVFISGTDVYYRVGTENQGYSYWSSVSIPTGQWHHIVFVRSGSDVEFYLNNASQGIQNPGSSFNATTKFDTIGGKPSGANDIVGNIDHLAAFDYALSASQITSLYGNSTDGVGNPMALSTKPVAYYKLGEKAAFNGSEYLVTNAASEVYSPYALDFDGTNDYIDCGSASYLNGVTQCSISLWINLDTAASRKTPLSTWNYGLSPRGQFAIQTDSSSGSTYGLTFWTPVSTTDNNGVTRSTGNVFNENTWHHLVIAYNAGAVQFYKDGSAITSAGPGTMPTSLAAGDGRLYIGQFGGLGRYWNGKLSNVSIWNAALTSTQATEIYNEGKPSNLNNHSAYANLVSWWQLGENMSYDGTKWTVIDEKGTNNGEGTNLGPAESAIVNGVGTSANGLSDGMGGADNIVGDAPYSTANAVSYGMGVDALSTSVPS